MQTEKNRAFIHEYTRAQAIEDGVLIDVTEPAKNEMGFLFPVAVTSSVYDKYIDWTEEDNKRQTYQDIEGRLHDILTMLGVAIRTSQKHGGTLHFKVYVIPRSASSRATRPRLTTLKSVVSGGDNGEPVITIMQLDED